MPNKIDEENARILGLEYARRLAEKRELEVEPGQPWGPFPGNRAECEGLVNVPPPEGNDSQEPLPAPRARAMAGRIYEVAKAEWEVIERRFTPDRKRPTTFS